MTPTEGQQRSGRLWGVVGCLGLFLLLAGGAVGYVVWARSLPPWSPPVRVLPEPNAYTEYAAAAAQIQRRPPEEDVSLADTPLAVVRGVVQEEKPHLDSIRKAFEYESAVPPSYSFYTPFPEFAHFRQAARLFAGEARVAEADGRWGDACQSALDAIELAGDIGRDGTILNMLVSAASQSIGIRPLERGIKHLSPTEAEATLLRLTGIDAEWGALAGNWKAERQMAVGGLYEVWRSGRVAEFVFGDGVSEFQIEPWYDLRQWYEVAKLELYPRQVVLRNYNAHLDALIDEANKPYPQRTTVPPPSDPINQMLSLEETPFWIQHEKTNTQRRLLRLMLALRIHRLRHGSYPETLKPLAELLGGELPLDPFADEPFRYVKTEVGYRLWSIGPDGVDDDGLLPLQRSASVDSLGDLIAGQLFEK